MRIIKQPVNKKYRSYDNQKFMRNTMFRVVTGTKKTGRRYYPSGNTKKSALRKFIKF